MLVGLFLCRLAYLKTHTSKVHKIFCVHLLWPWLNPRLTLLTSSFVIRVTFALNGLCGTWQEGV